MRTVGKRLVQKYHSIHCYLGLTTIKYAAKALSYQHQESATKFNLKLVIFLCKSTEENEEAFLSLTSTMQQLMTQAMLKHLVGNLDLTKQHVEI